MKFFMCANHAHDPSESSLLFYRALVRFKFHEMTYLLVLYLYVLVRLFFVAVTAVALPMVSLDRHGAAGLGVVLD
jgi:hypothetical protein